MYFLKKLLALVFICGMVSFSVFAVPFSFSSQTDISMLDPASEALGGAGVGDPSASFILNPVNATSGTIDLSLPWAAFRTSAPVSTLQSMRNKDWNSIAWNLPAGNEEVFNVQTGAGSRFAHFAFDVRGGARLVSLSSVGEEGGALMSRLFANLNGSFRVAGGGKLVYKGRHTLAWGFGTGVDAVMWTEESSAVNLAQKGVVEGVLKDVPLYTEASVPVSLGLSYSYRDMITVAGTVRNDSLLLFFRNTFLDHTVAEDMVTDHFADLFAGSVGFNLDDGWTGDFGVSFRYKLGKWKFKALADIQDIAGLADDFNNSLSYIHGGLEAAVNGISLRFGFNRGVTFGIGLDMEYMFLDAAISRVSLPHPGEAQATYLSIKARVGF